MLAIPSLLAAGFLIGQTDTLTLDGALARALLHRPSARTGATVAAAGRASAGLIRQVPNPVVEYTHDASSPSDQIKVTQPLDWLIRSPAHHAAGRATTRVAEADSATATASLAREVRIAYFTALAASIAQGIAAAQARLADSLVAIATRRLVAGDASSLERQQFLLEAGRARQFASVTREEDRVARAALARALGDASVKEATLADSLDRGLELGPPPRPALPDSLPAMLRATSDSTAAAELYSSSKLQRLPVPSLIIGRDWSTNGPFSEGSTGLIGFTVPFPLFNLRGSQTARARTRSEEADIAVAEARLETNRRLEEGEVRLTEARDRALFARDSMVSAAGRLRSGVLRLYAEGELGVLPVLESLRGEREVMLAQVQALLGYQRALADWLFLLGRID
jgi:outer membrane protein TolC